MELIQELSGEFKIKKGPSSISISYDDARHLIGSDFYECDYNVLKAKEFYNVKS